MNNLPFIQADYAGYAASLEPLRVHCLDYPRTVSIETQVNCNAKCNFCPYPTSPRQGQVMPDEVFDKIINDLSRIPHSHPFGVTLHRINEPLLDRRMQRFCQTVAEKLPSAIQEFWTNGTMLKKGGFEWMTRYPRASLAVSLNSVDEEEHVRIMGFGLKTVVEGLDYLHGLLSSRQFTLPVALCAPYRNVDQANRYQAECRARWPLFQPVIRPFFQWMGESAAGAQDRAASALPALDAVKTSKSACAQWFDLHILASGFVTRCCIDETGHDGDPAFDVRQRDVLEIYRNSRLLRLNLPARSGIGGCEGCVHLG